MNILSENRLNELPADTPIWMLINKSASNFYLRIPLDARSEPDIIGFLEEQDAGRIIGLLKNYAAYQNLNISAESELLTEVRSGARLYEQPIYFFDHAQTSELLAALPEILENYKG